MTNIIVLVIIIDNTFFFLAAVLDKNNCNIHIRRILFENVEFIMVQHHRKQR